MSGPLTVEPLPLSASQPREPDPTSTTVSRFADLTLALSRVCSVVLTAVSSAVVARSLGPQGYGVFAAGAAVASLMVLGRAFGADALYLRGSIDADTFHRRATGSAAINLALVVAAGLAWPGLTWAGRGCEMLMGAAWAAAFSRLPWQVVPTRHFGFAIRARRELLLSVLSLGGVMVLASVFHRPVLASAGLLVGTVAVVIWSWVSRGKEPADGAPLVGSGSIRSGLSFTAIEALFLAYFLLDGAMIAAMRPPTDAGIYRVAYAFVFAAAVIPVALNADVLRVRLWRLAGVARGLALRRAVIQTATTALGVTLAFELLGGVGERLFFGTAFAAAIPVIRILGAAMPFHYANSVFSNLHVGAGRISTVVRIQALMLAINIVANLLLIPAHGPRGAAVATVITEAAGLVIYVAVPKPRVH